MAATEAAAEPEAEQDEADQMRDTGEGSARHQPTREQKENYPRPTKTGQVRERATGDDAEISTKKGKEKKGTRTGPKG